MVEVYFKEITMLSKFEVISAEPLLKQVLVTFWAVSCFPCRTPDFGS